MALVANAPVFEGLVVLADQADDEKRGGRDIRSGGPHLGDGRADGLDPGVAHPIIQKSLMDRLVVIDQNAGQNGQARDGRRSLVRI